MKAFKKLKKIFAHPEVENYGLNCDYNLWKEFNKEVLSRSLITIERAIFSQLKVAAGFPPIEYPETFTEVERNYAECKLNILIKSGILNKETYLFNKEKLNGK